MKMSSPMKRADINNKHRLSEVSRANIIMNMNNINSSKVNKDSINKSNNINIRLNKEEDVVASPSTTTSSKMSKDKGFPSVVTGKRKPTLRLTELNRNDIMAIRKVPVVEKKNTVKVTGSIIKQTPSSLQASIMKKRCYMKVPPLTTTAKGIVTSSKKQTCSIIANPPVPSNMKKKDEESTSSSSSDNDDNCSSSSSLSDSHDDMSCYSDESSNSSNTSGPIELPFRKRDDSRYLHHRQLNMKDRSICSYSSPTTSSLVVPNNNYVHDHNTCYFTCIAPSSPSTHCIDTQTSDHEGEEHSSSSPILNNDIISSPISPVDVVMPNVDSKLVEPSNKDDCRSNTPTIQGQELKKSKSRNRNSSQRQRMKRQRARQLANNNNNKGNNNINNNIDIEQGSSIDIVLHEDNIIINKNNIDAEPVVIDVPNPSSSDSLNIVVDMKNNGCSSLSGGTLSGGDRVDMKGNIDVNMNNNNNKSIDTTNQSLLHSSISSTLTEEEKDIEDLIKRADKLDALYEETFNESCSYTVESQQVKQQQQVVVHEKPIIEAPLSTSSSSNNNNNNISDVKIKTEGEKLSYHNNYSNDMNDYDHDDDDDNNSDIIYIGIYESKKKPIKSGDHHNHRETSRSKRLKIDNHEERVPTTTSEYVDQNSSNNSSSNKRKKDKEYYDKSIMNEDGTSVSESHDDRELSDSTSSNMSINSYSCDELDDSEDLRRKVDAGRSSPYNMRKKRRIDSSTSSSSSDDSSSDAESISENVLLSSSDTHNNNINDKSCMNKNDTSSPLIPSSVEQKNTMKKRCEEVIRRLLSNNTTTMKSSRRYSRNVLKHNRRRRRNSSSNNCINNLLPGHLVSSLSSSCSKRYNDRRSGMRKYGSKARLCVGYGSSSMSSVRQQQQSMMTVKRLSKLDSVINKRKLIKTILSKVLTNNSPRTTSCHPDDQQSSYCDRCGTRGSRALRNTDRVTRFKPCRCRTAINPSDGQPGSCYNNNKHIFYCLLSSSSDDDEHNIMLSDESQVRRSYRIRESQAYNLISDSFNWNCQSDACHTHDDDFLAGCPPSPPPSIDEGTHRIGAIEYRNFFKVKASSIKPIPSYGITRDWLLKNILCHTNITIGFLVQQKLLSYKHICKAHGDDVGEYDCTLRQDRQSVYFRHSYFSELRGRYLSCNVSIFNGTVFEHCQIGVKAFLYLALMFVKGYLIKDAMESCKLDNNFDITRTTTSQLTASTVVKHYRFFREVLFDHYYIAEDQADLEAKQLGGPGMIVIIDETYFHQNKPHKYASWRPDSLVIMLLEVNEKQFNERYPGPDECSEKMSAERKEELNVNRLKKLKSRFLGISLDGSPHIVKSKRGKKQLKANNKDIEVVLKKWIKPGTTLMTDQHRGYMSFYDKHCNSMDLKHRFCNHSRGFSARDEYGDFNTNMIEGCISLVKRRLSCGGFRRDMLPLYMAHYSFVREHSNENGFEAFLQILRKTQLRYSVKGSLKEKDLFMFDMWGKGADRVPPRKVPNPRKKKKRSSRR